MNNTSTAPTAETPSRSTSYGFVVQRFLPPDWTPPGDRPVDSFFERALKRCNASFEDAAVYNTASEALSAIAEFGAKFPSLVQGENRETFNLIRVSIETIPAQTRRVKEAVI